MSLGSPSLSLILIWLEREELQQVLNEYLLLQFLSCLYDFCFWYFECLMGSARAASLWSFFYCESITNWDFYLLFYRRRWCNKAKTVITNQCSFVFLAEICVVIMFLRFFGWIWRCNIVSALSLSYLQIYALSHFGWNNWAASVLLFSSFNYFFCLYIQNMWCCV